MIGAEVEPLTYLIPELEEVVPEFSTMSYSDGSSMEGMQERWKYSFRALTRLLTAQVKPLVLVIDDLQWADKGSLDLIQDLITDAQNLKPLMVIGCYRSNEVDEKSDLSKLVSALQKNRDKYGVEITEIEVEGFGSTEVNHMIMKMMDSDDEEMTKDLAEICFQRTLGNPFFVIEFMSMLHREELIEFNIGTMKWVYDVAQIEEATMSTANVVELLQTRMQQMPEDVQMLLSIAACLGPSFRTSTLELVWNNLAYVRSKGFEHDKVEELLDVIQLEMLIEPGTGGSYRWVHDKVQEAALTFVEIDKDSFKFAMGKVLYLNLMGKELDNELFDVVDLIGSGGTGEKSADIASLFLKAAKKARSIAAFVSCSRYIKLGIQMLPNDHWKTDQSSTLDLYTLGAQVEFAL